MDNAIRVGICHGNLLLADCLHLTLNHKPGFRCEILNPDASSPILDSIDVLLLDATLPPLRISSAIEYARRSNRKSSILLIVSRHVADRMLEFTRLGADGCIFDQSPIEELHLAIQTVARGETYCSLHAANAIFLLAGNQQAEVANWSSHLHHVKLTSREREILELIAWEKLGNKQIARRLNISLYTVKNHVHNIIEKLGVDDRHEAAEQANRLLLLRS